MNVRKWMLAAAVLLALGVPSLAPAQTQSSTVQIKKPV